MSPPIRIVIADDHPIFRKGLRELIEKDAGLEVVADCADGESALVAIVEEAPDVAVLDLDMPGGDGFAVVCAMREREIRIPAILLTMHGREDLLGAAIDAGILGYVVKDGAVTDILQAIHAVHEGRPYISSSLSAALLAGRAKGKGGRAQAAAPRSTLDPVAAELARLSPAERRVLRLIADFKTSKEIAVELGVHYRTVENHRTNIAQKLGLSGSHSLSRFVAQYRDLLE